MSVPPLAADYDVRIFRTQLPKCEYDEVGVVTWPVMSRKLQVGVDRMRARAREMGGHAIVGFNIGERSTGTTTTIVGDSSRVTVGTSMDTESTASGTVVRFRSEECMN